jgi:DNA-binding SARP family transcriptional activator
VESLAGGSGREVNNRSTRRLSPADRRCYGRLSTSVAFFILGPLEARERQGRLALGPPTQRALLALLLLNANRVVLLERLIDQLWGERAPETAAHAIRVYVSRLRKVLGNDILETRGGGYIVHIAPQQLDLARFEANVDNALKDLAAGAALRAADELRDALALWRGPALADLELEALAFERERLEELRLAIVTARIDADLALGRHAELVPELEALVREHPFRERFCEQLMSALYRSGRQAEALDAYQRTRRRLADELAIEPGRRLRELQQAILMHDASLGAPPARRSAHDRTLAERAALKLARAGERAARRPDVQASVALLSRAASLLPADNPVRIALLPDLAATLAAVGDLDVAHRLLDEAAGAAEATGDRALEWQARTRGRILGMYTIPRGTPTAVARADAQRALGEFGALGDRRGLAQASNLLALAASSNEEAEHVAASAIEHARAAQDVREQAWGAVTLTGAFLFGPLPVELAVARCRETLEWAPGRWAQAMGLLRLGWLETMAGRDETGRRLRARGRRVVRALSEESGLTMGLLEFGFAELEAGATASAEGELRLGQALAPPQKTALQVGFSLGLARALCLQSRFEEAERLSRLEPQLVPAGLEVVTWIAPYALALWHTTRARALAGLGRADEAAQLIRTRLELGAGTDSPNTEAEVRIDAAEVFWALGETSSAGRMAEEAATLYESKGNVPGAARARVGAPFIGRG